jgi:hypothetical protein
MEGRGPKKLALEPRRLWEPPYMNADYERNGSKSTPAAITRWTNRPDHEWAGRYHHWDGYPWALGATLFDLVRQCTLGDLATTLRGLIDDHPAGWSTINGADWALRPGFTERWKDESGKKLALDLAALWEPLYERTRRTQLEATLVELPPAEAMRLQRNKQFILWNSLTHYFGALRRARCYCHGDRDEVPWELTQDDAASYGVEWVYVFDVAERTMTVLEAMLEGCHSLSLGLPFLYLSSGNASAVTRAVPENCAIR